MDMCGKSQTDQAGAVWTGIPSVPIPMAIFGMIVAFMFGATMAAAKSRKLAMMAETPEGDKPWMHHGMKGRHHHHHGEGSPACCERHGGWPKHQMAPEDDASGE